jgi:yecA family protein
MKKEYSETFQEIEEFVKEKVQKRLNIEFIHGYLTALVCCPVYIDDEKWIGFLFWDPKTEKKQEWASEDDDDEAFDLLTRGFDEIYDFLQDHNFVPLISPEIEFVTIDMTKKWCKGFIYGLGFWAVNEIKMENYQDELYAVFHYAGKADYKMDLKKLSRKEFEAIKYMMDKPREFLSESISLLYDKILMDEKYEE